MSVTIASANDIISNITYSQPDKIKQYSSIQPLLTMVSSSKFDVYNSLVSEIKSVLPIITYIKKSASTISQNKAVVDYITQNATSIIQTFQTLEDNYTKKVVYPQTSSMDKRNLETLSPSMAVVSQLKSEHQYVISMNIAICQTYMLLLVCAISLLMNTNDTSIVIGNYMKIMQKKYSEWLDDTKVLGIVVPLSSTDNRIFRSKVKDSLSSTQLQQYCFGSSQSDTVQFIRQVIMQVYSIEDGSSSSLSLGDLKSKFYLRLIQQFVFAPFFENYNEYTGKTSLTKVLAMDMNVYVKETYVNEYTSSTSYVSSRRREPAIRSSRRFPFGGGYERSGNLFSDW